MVLQDTWLFEGTIADNIGYGKSDATREEIIAAAKTVQCDSFIDKLPDGYDTVISDENSALSAGGGRERNSCFPLHASYWPIRIF